MSQIDDTAQQNATSPTTDIVLASATTAVATSTPRHAQCYQAFLRDLPSLLDQYPGQWAAYAGDKRLAIGLSKRELYRKCMMAGYHEGDFLICGIEPPQNVVLDELVEV